MQSTERWPSATMDDVCVCVCCVCFLRDIFVFLFACLWCLNEIQITVYNATFPRAVRLELHNVSPIFMVETRRYGTGDKELFVPHSTSHFETRPDGRHVEYGYPHNFLPCLLPVPFSCE